MDKYSTGSSSSDGGTTCELCGAESGSLERTRVAGAMLDVCGSCASHGERSGGGESTKQRERSQESTQAAARTTPMWDGDTEHWERDGTNYDDDPLPYLVAGYGELLTEARQSAGLQREELAEEVGIREQDLLSIEQGRATQTGVGGGVIEALEEVLDIELAE